MERYLVLVGDGSISGLFYGAVIASGVNYVPLSIPSVMAMTIAGAFPVYMGEERIAKEIIDRIVNEMLDGKIEIRIGGESLDNR